MSNLSSPRALTAGGGESEIRYSICTLVTRLDEYQECIQSFRNKGFSGPDCEYLYIDNSNKNQYDAFSGYNRFLQEAAGKYIILCHQDILLIDDDRSRLERLLAELDSLDPLWGLCGNAGGKTDGGLAVRITDPNTGDTNTGGPFPARAVSLDENFIVVRREANLALSRDLAGFHLYGAEMCIIADILGYNAYIIAFHLLHKSGGNIDRSFESIRENIMAKYSRALRPRWIYVTTLRSFYLTASKLDRVRDKISRRFSRLKSRIGIK